MTILVLLLAFLAVASVWILLDRSGGRPSQLAQYNSFHGASEFVLGENRFPFALATLEGDPLANASISVSFYHLLGSDWHYRLSRDAEYREIEGVTPHFHDDGSIHNHPDVRGQYLAQANFQSPGIWQARFSLSNEDEPTLSIGDLAFNVLTEPSAPGIGEPAPPVKNLTIHDVPSIHEIESRDPPDNMHNLSVVEALKQEKPFVVAWTTPMFCTSAICGPVLDAVVSVQDKFVDSVNFIHIEPWNLETARNEGRLIPVPEFTQWGLTTEPWIFVVDSQGLIHSRFEGLVTYTELKEAVSAVLNPVP